MQNYTTGLYGLFGLGALISAYTDVKYSKIYNVITLPLFIIGILSVATFHNISFFEMLKSIGIAAGFFIPLFALKWMGAGDAKLVIALSTILNSKNTIEMIYIALLITAMTGLLVLIYQKRTKQYFKTIFTWFQTLMHPEFKATLPRFEKTTPVPFAVAVFVGYLSVVII